MSYTKQTFNEGNRLKAEHLNHIEDGLFNLDGNLNKNEIFLESFLDTFYSYKELEYGNYYVNNNSQSKQIMPGQIIEIELNADAGGNRSITISFLDGSSKSIIFKNGEEKRLIRVESNWNYINIGAYFKVKLYSRNDKPLILYSDKAEEYNTNSIYGEEALQAIIDGRQILVKVPNADGGEYTAIYSPVYMYQVPNKENNYLYLFYLKDEKNSLDLTALGMGVLELPAYGQLKMKLSKMHNYDPVSGYVPINFTGTGASYASSISIGSSKISDIDKNRFLKAGEPFVATIKTTSNISLSSIKVYMDGVQVSTGKNINIPKVTGLVEINMTLGSAYTDPF